MVYASPEVRGSMELAYANLHRRVLQCRSFAVSQLNSRAFIESPLQ